MEIYRSVIDIINNKVDGVPYEIGGILGSDDNGIINRIVIDLSDSVTAPCRYSPNVNFLNHAIEEWSNSGIDFVGFFHTHFAGVKTLSNGDKQYIKSIMNAMPNRVNILYFPIFVLPNREMVCYKAIKHQGHIEIVFEETFIK